MVLDREPIGLDDAAEYDPRCKHHQYRNDQIARQAPASFEDDVGHDCNRHSEQGHEPEPPQRVRPSENRAERVRDGLVTLGRGGGDDGGEADDDRRPREQHRVDRAPVPAPRLGLRQQAEPRRFASRHV